MRQGLQLDDLLECSIARFNLLSIVAIFNSGVRQGLQLDDLLECSIARFKLLFSVAELSEFLSSQDFYIALRETSTALGMFSLLIFG